MSTSYQRLYKPFSMRDDDSKTKYRTIGQELMDTLGVEEVTRLWNETGLGRPSNKNTVDRWLRPGPLNKNPNFEGFAVTLNKQAHNNKPSKTKSLQKNITMLEEAHSTNKISNTRDQAVAASLIAFYEYDKSMSYKQKRLINTLIERYDITE